MKQETNPRTEDVAWRVRVWANPALSDEDERRRRERLRAENLAAGKSPTSPTLDWDTSGVGTSVEAKAEGSLAECLDAIADAAEEVMRRLAPAPDPWRLTGLHVELHNDDTYIPSAGALAARPAQGWQTPDEAVAFLEAFCECAERLYGPSDVSDGA